MYQITVDVLCQDGYSELLPSDRESTELIVEDLVARLLLDQFSMITIDKVALISSTQQSVYRLHAEALCALETRGAFTGSLDTLEIMLEDVICCVLLELFSLVVINKIHISYEGNVVVLPCNV